MLLQPPVVQEHFFFRRIFVYLFFVRGFSFTDLQYLPYFRIYLIYLFTYLPYFLYKSLRTEMNLDQMGLAILRSK